MHLNNIEEKNQPVFNKLIYSIRNNNISSQAYFLSGNSKSNLKEYSILLAKNLICKDKFTDNCTKCNICKRIDNDTYSELKIITPINGVIKKETIIDLRKKYQVKSIESKNQVYIINDAEKLNVASANSILKFLEEPESNTVAIFNSTNIDSVINTIVSRCQIININDNDKQNGIEYLKKCYSLNDENMDDVINFFYSIEKNSKRTLCNINSLLLVKYDNKEQIKNFINVLLFIYVDLLNYQYLKEFKYFGEYNELKNYVDNNKISKIIKKISFILENIDKLDYNVNILLYIDNLIIGIGAINDDESSRN